MNSRLDNKTTIPLWSVLTSIPIICGFIFWLSYIANTTTANSVQIVDLQKSKEEQFKILIEIRSDVLIIKERMSALSKPNKEGQK